MSGMTITPKVLGITRGNVSHQLRDIIEMAGRTCYKSDGKIGDGTAEPFIKGIIKRGHESVIEHSWFVAHLKDATAYQYLANIFMTSRLLSCSQRENGEFLISGNARMFRDYFRKLKKWGTNDRDLLEDLQNISPLLFSDIQLPESMVATKSLVPRFTTAVLSADEFTREEKLRHWWAAVKITGGSRAFTHQWVRHRLEAISQESQRYCDEAGIFANGYFVVPPSIIAAGQEQFYLDCIKQIDEWYQQLISAVQASGSGKAREDARFLLPNACCSEIVVSCNLEEWRQIFKMRCDDHAQWEIRDGAMEILEEFQTTFPGCFDDFIISEDRTHASLAA